MFDTILQGFLRGKQTSEVILIEKKVEKIILWVFPFDYVIRIKLLGLYCVNYESKVKMSDVK